MKRPIQIKLAIIVVAVVAALWSLLPTIQLATGTDGMSDEAVASLEDRAIRRGLDLAGGMYLILEVDQEQLDASGTEMTQDDALDRVITVLRNRIDEFGVSEPDIRKEGSSRVVVQLPGLQDPERAKALIGRTARLTFQLVREGNEVANVLTRVDEIVASLLRNEGTLPDSLQVEGDAGQAPLPEGLNPQRPFTALLGQPFMGGYSLLVSNRDELEAILARREVQRVIPRDVQFLFSAEVMKTLDPNEQGTLLYLVEREIAVAGSEIANAVIGPDPDRPGLQLVNLELTRRGGLRFANVTGANVNRKLAIVLDERVHSAPNISGKISGGRATISGGFGTVQEAQDLALMLRAGALPADVEIAEERTVGPSLGADSIDQGVQSIWIGGLVVIGFIIIYYKVAGLLATLGLTVTMLLLLAILAQFGLVLTLPGIAGIILTVGMAVDANVLIFERIREELRNGKPVRAAIDAGYGQATRAIIDANVTTFIAAFVLYYFGTGPIKGFAVTLSVGILTSMFSALVFTRTMYDLWLGNRQPKSISI